MPVLTRDFAEHFARDWIAAWNSKDLDRVLAHYREDFVFHSPFIVAVAGEASGKLAGKAAVRGYWEKALARIERLNFELVDLLVGVDSLTIYYRGHRGMVAETFFFDERGVVTLATACYANA